MAAACAPLALLAKANPLQSGRGTAGREHTLRTLLDTLIPADASPAASALGIDRTLLELAVRNEDYSRLLDEGAAWLDRSARALGAQSFAAGTEEQRIAIVRQAERARPQTLPRRLFERVRYDALRLYYAQPATWPSVGYAGPPQPVGFPDFERPPAVRR